MNYHTYSMDMVGYGNSDMLVDGFEHTFDQSGRGHIKDVIKELDVKGDVILAAHGHGEAVQIFASKYPCHLKRLILVNPVSFDYWPGLAVETFNAMVGASDETYARLFREL